MNRKGFTLVEVVAVVAILGIIFGIASYSVIGVINSSKKKSEEVFVDNIKTYIDEYITLYGSSLSKKNTDEYNFEKCKISDDCTTVTAYEYSSISINDLIDKGLVTEGKFVNPVNKLDCFDGINPSIRIFKDSDYVYYYYVDLRGDNTSCEITGKHGVINTLPDSLIDVVGLE